MYTYIHIYFYVYIYTYIYIYIEYGYIFSTVFVGNQNSIYIYTTLRIYPDPPLCTTRIPTSSAARWPSARSRSPASSAARPRMTPPKRRTQGGMGLGLEVREPASE